MQSLLNDSVTILGLLGALAILILTAFIVSTYLNKMKHSKADGVLTQENWDGIKEFKNDLPIGWSTIFLCVIIWALWYMFIGYPLNAYSQIGEYNREVNNYNKSFEEKWTNLSESELSIMGDNIFQVQCSQCHGIDKSGIDGKAANLNSWGRKEYIVNVILKGSKGMNFLAGEMVPIAISKEEAEAIADFVMAEISNSKTPANAETIAKGKELFSVNCVACHGVDGKGVEGMADFAPDLSKYGTHEFLQIVLSRGKNGHIGKMPSFDYVNFDEIQEKALNSFILSDE
ncbi:c-type cytochrome [Helicobacter sp. MIT 99-5507]|uniref:c-type cytochrome n=1 Tax=Helicobacter sp. MIT 99-5507 TaxID=152489 RepID=UPI000E1EE40D|nr:c-type cytochrome [Helicobacter sp. MIT 99-5507]RDU58173.1 cytochrome C oxidase Cbb3 [Helicobacter sp. MIT 99-5507]